MRRRRFARVNPRTDERGMNKTEASYADHLRLRRAAGEVGDFWFEGIKLKLAKRCFYTPDFLVQLPDGLMELHEVKGFWEDDARVKCKAVADKFPFRMIAVQKDGKHGWKVEEL